MSIQKTFFAGIRWTGFSSLLSFVLGLLQVALLARYLEKSDFAWVAIAGVFVNIGIQIQNAGINTALIKHLENTPVQLSSLFWLNQVISFILLLLGLIGAELTGKLYQSTTLTTVFAVYSIVFIINGIGVQYKAILQKHIYFRELAILEIWGIIGSFFVAIGLASEGWGAMAIIIGYLTRYIIETTGAWLYGYCIFIPQWHFHYQELKSYRNFGAILTLERLVTHFVAQLDVLLISKWLGVESAGVYDVFKRTLMRPSVLLNLAIEKISLPVLSNLQQNNLTFSKTFFNILNISLSLHIPVYFSVAIASPWIVQWYFGNSWLPYVSIFQILCFFTILNAFFNPIESLLLMKNKIHLLLFYNCAYAIILFLIIWIERFLSFEFILYSILSFSWIFVLVFYHFILKLTLGLNLSHLKQPMSEPILINGLSMLSFIPLFLKFSFINILFCVALYVVLVVFLNYYNKTAIYILFRNIYKQ